MRRKVTLLTCLLPVLLLRLAGIEMAVHGQSTNATITGLVKDAAGAALPGATVIVRNESTGFQSATATGPEGTFVFRQLPLGNPYTVSASYVGYNEQKKTGFSLNQGNRLEVNFALRQTSTQLEEIVVTDQGFAKQVEQRGAATSITENQIKTLPLEGRNFTNLTRLSPLQGAGDINLGGQRRTSTNITIDGANARNQLLAGEIGQGAYSISQEAIREFEVVTNSYDVTQGRQGGGAINAVTKSGTNTFTGSAFVYHRNNQLSSPFDIRGVRRTQDFYNYQWGFSLGGPIIRDKMHFFVAFDREDAGSPLFITDIRDEDDERRLGVRKDTLDKAIDVARRLYGVSNGQQVGEFARKTTTNTLFARVDWQLSPKHRLTLRNNYSSFNNPFSTDDNSGINIREVWSDFTANQNSLLLSLRSAFSNNLTNEIKVQLQRNERDFQPSPELPAANIPRAIVTLVSPFPTESNPRATQSRTFQFGGQRFTPEYTLDRQIHLINTTYLSKGRYNFTFGTDNMITFLETLITNEQNGRFFFNSLQDLENVRPFRYAREVPLQGGSPTVNQTVLDLALFAQVEFKPWPNVSTEFGLRYDATVFMTPADYNPVVDEQLGIRTDVKPSDWNNIQPRLQLTWNMGGRDRDVLKIGGGIFASQPHYYAQVNNIQNSGTLLGAIDVTGSQVPAPDFIAYRNDPSSVPGIPAGAAYISTINSVREDFQVPTTMKANVSYSKIIGNRFTIGLNGLISRTFNNYVYQERNLVDEPYFRIAAEGNRGVFVPAGTITPRGVTDWLNSRKSTQVGRVLELTSEGILNQMALVVDAQVRLGKDGYVNVSYTANRARDNSSYNCCVANTATFLPVKDDPRALNYGFSDNHFSNKVVLSGATPTWKGFQLGATFAGDAGSRYSFHVARTVSINGDFNLENDLAYVFDPNSPETPADIAEGINEILGDPNTAESAKEYLRNNFGRIAERNGGRNPFAATVDLRLIKSFRTFGSQRLQLSADLFNAANLLSREWGRNANLGRRRELLRVQGFDQPSAQYTYRVESGAGVKPINGTPWRLQLGVRYGF